MALSIARILPPGRLRKVAVGISIGCFVSGVIMLTFVVMTTDVLSHRWVSWPIANRWMVMVPQIIGAF